MAAVESRVMEVDNAQKKTQKSVDREKTCPLLLRVFCNYNSHHRLTEYGRANMVPANELQIYTWLDASLKELSSLVKEVNPDARRRGTLFDFAVVYPDLRRPGYRMREIGTTCSGKKGTDDAVTLGSTQFQIGDYLDIAITIPGRAPARRY
ncbi:histone deacetylase complex subunit SAP18-like [Ptychodera flava]|uniref:histone deacetylase complex subunit SAP18-like n=1 Tax=Ptychodera flava TaxID=63121 RepID=UPI00396A1A86